jgi:2,4-diketo-3-deoxy-L-fuconate hydrolase
LRIVNVDGRVGMLTGQVVVDVHRASKGQFGPEALDVLTRWEEFRVWAEAIGPSSGVPLSEVRLGPPVPKPSQIFAVGLNYVDHATESGFQVPSEPIIFTKFASSLCGPEETVDLPPGHVDWEVELVVVVGRLASGISEKDAWGHVAGVMVGQDLSERVLQFSGHPPQQYSLAKSFAHFGPTGPAMVTVDELDDPDDMEIRCRLNGEDVQLASTADMIFPVPALLARLSKVVTLLPGDLIFTGTPQGVGMGRSPQRYLSHGDTMESYIEGIGTIRQEFVDGTRQQPNPLQSNSVEEVSLLH